MAQSEEGSHDSAVFLIGFITITQKPAFCVLQLTIAKCCLYWLQPTAYAKSNISTTKTVMLVFVSKISFLEIVKNYWLTPTSFSCVQERDELTYS